jgi:hypothetical protein
MNTHLSQSIGAGDFEGQHGMSPAISSAGPGIDISSAIAAIDSSAVGPAMTGRDSGASTSPAITEIARHRAMNRRRTMTLLDTEKDGLKEAWLHMCDSAAGINARFWGPSHEPPDLTI